jgi:predicted tellurium resistance membrane protein TerC
VLYDDLDEQRITGTTIARGKERPGPMEWLTSAEGWIALLTLTSLEIVLGIDNIIFISILADRLPESQQARARTVGLSLAMIMRILLLLSISWVIGLTAPIFSLFGEELSGRDLILIVGGLFLLGKATFEVHEKLEGSEEHEEAGAGRKTASFASVIVQILLLDVVFSLDSVITAVGMADEVSIMITAVVIAIGVMLVSAAAISDFVNKHPTVKMLALSFLLLIGMSLVAEGWDQHIPKGYIYFAMGFSVLVEMLNLRVRQVTSKPVQLRSAYTKGEGTQGAVPPPTERERTGKAV